MSARTLPRLWPFLLAFAALLVLWVLALELLMKPEALATVATPPLHRLRWWIVPPLAVAYDVSADDCLVTVLAVWKTET